MLRAYRFVLRPSWVLGHLLVIGLAAGTTTLGFWQLGVSERRHFSPQNFGYALQWWAFTLFGIGMWFKIIHDHRRTLAARAGEQLPERRPVQNRPPAVPETPVTYRRYVPPVGGRQELPADETLTAYNDYLAALNAHASRSDRPRQERTDL